MIKILKKAYQKEFKGKPEDIIKNIKRIFLKENKAKSLHKKKLKAKLYGQNEIFNLSKEIGIKVEFPNGFIDFINKFPLLKLFHYKTLLLKFTRLIVPKDFLSNNVQIFSNFLKDFNEDKINKIDLYFEKICLKIFTIMKQKKMLKF